MFRWEPQDGPALLCAPAHAADALGAAPTPGGGVWRQILRVVILLKSPPTSMWVWLSKIRTPSGTLLNGNMD